MLTRWAAAAPSAARAALGAHSKALTKKSKIRYIFLKTNTFTFLNYILHENVSSKGLLVCGSNQLFQLLGVLIEHANPFRELFRGHGILVEHPPEAFFIVGKTF